VPGALFDVANGINDAEQVVPGIEIPVMISACGRPGTLIIELVKLLKRAERDWRAREESNP
jgi:hypothetical protein